jgi:peroxiredoxin (alkyl hydroperoxide reductase subunit C)
MEEKMPARMPLIGELAPGFHAVSTQGEINFPEDFSGRWIVLFSHPGDFTPVCTTEFMTFASMMNEFKALNTELIGLSIDSLYSHIAWLRRIRELSWKNMKHAEVTFPLIADSSMEIARQYGMIHPYNSQTQTVRAVFIIDPEGIIRTILYYPASTGRNIPEIKRILMSLQKVDAEKIATPADWMPCDDVIIPPPGTCGAARERMERGGENLYCLDWFLCFKQSGCSPYSNTNEPEFLPYPSVFSTNNRINNRR